MWVMAGVSITDFAPGHQVQRLTIIDITAIIITVVVFPLL